MGIPIYVISLGNHSRVRMMDTRPLLYKIAKATGGTDFRIGEARELPAVYERIAEELRNQYVLSFEPPDGPEGWHAVRLKVERPRTQVRTVSGFLIAP